MVFRLFVLSLSQESFKDSNAHEPYFVNKEWKENKQYDLLVFFFVALNGDCDREKN